METPFERYVREFNAAIASNAPLCPICHGVIVGGVAHDHQPDQSGLDDGPWLPGRAPRKKMEPKSPDETSRIRAQAWETRRAKYGPHGHR